MADTQRRDLATDQLKKAAKMGPPSLRLSSASYPTIIDPETVAEGIFGSIDLENRESLIALIESLVPEETDDAATTSIARRGSSTQAARRLLTVGGPYEAARSAARSLTDNSALLNAIKGPGGASSVEDRTILKLIHDDVAELVSLLDRPDPPEGRINAVLGDLCGYKPDTWTGVDVHSAAGLLGRARSRFQVDVGDPFGNETVRTAFSSLVAQVNTLAVTWHAARKMDGESALHRGLGLILANLARLREQVSPTVWFTTTLNTDTPMVAGELYSWAFDFASSQAPQLMKYGRDGVESIAWSAKRLAVQVKKGFLDSTPIPRKPSRTPSKGPQPCSDELPEDITLPDDYCAALPAAFTKPEVKNVVTELLCGFQQTLEATSALLSASTTVTSCTVLDDQKKLIRYAAQKQKILLQVCGTNADCAAVRLECEDGTMIEATLDASCEGGATYRVDLANATPGLCGVIAGSKRIRDFFVAPGASKKATA